MMRYILHADGDNFFANCLLTKYPRYKGLPLVVGEERGIVTALSPEAKQQGMSRGMSIFEVRERFKHATILPGDYKLFGRISKRLHALIGETSSCVEEYSIDESFADVTEATTKRRETPEAIAREVKTRLTTQLGIPISIGIAPTKTLAKLVSTSSKPDGCKVALERDVLDPLLANTPIEKVWGIGRKTAVKLRVRGIHTALELRDAPEHALAEFARPLREIRLELSGVAVHAVATVHAEEQSMISSHTFPATSDRAFIAHALAGHVDHLAWRLRKHGTAARKLSVYVKNRLHQIRGTEALLSRHENTPGPFLEQLDRLLAEILVPGEFIRTTGASVTDIIPETAREMSLFGPSADREAKVFATIDALRKQGACAVQSARLLRK